MDEKNDIQVQPTDKSATLKAMYDVGAHYGYRRSRRHPSMAPYIFGIKNNVELFDLEKTWSMLATAREFIAKMAREGKKVLFVASKHEARRAVREGAVAIEQPYVSSRWIGGTLTNFSEIHKRVSRLEELRQGRASGELATRYLKKELLMIDREIERLERNFDGIVGMNAPPAAMVIVDSRNEATALREARQLGIPVVSLDGSDCDSTKITYPVPANDSSRSSIEFFLNEIITAFREGAQQKADIVETPKPITAQ